MPLAGAHARNLVDASLGTATFVATVNPLRTRFMTANGSGDVNGTELATGGGYTAGAGINVTFAAAAAVAGPPAEARAASNVAVTQTNMPATTIVGIELWDSAVTALRKWYGGLATNRTVAAGDTLSFASSAITAACGV